MVAYTVGSSSSGIKSFLLSMLGFLFIIGLFFIPEILNFKKSPAGSTDGVKTFKTSQKDSGTKSDVSELSKISSLVDSGYLKKISKSSPDTNDKNTADNLRSKEEPEVLDPKKPALKWALIKSGEQRRAFKNADTQIGQLIERLSGDQKDSRIALLDMSSLLKKLGSGKLEKNYTAKQALEALEKSYTKVVNSFISDSVNTILFKRFVGINFGPLARDWSAKLSGKTIPFHPHLTVTGFSLSDKARKGATEPELSLSMEGYVIGDDVSRIQLVVGGLELNDVKLKKSDNDGYRKFKIQKFDLNGKVLFKVYDRTGRVFQKLYSIYPRAKIFQDQKGRYSIPKSASHLDTRLDRYFTMSSSATEFSNLDDGNQILESNGFESF